MTDWKLCSVVRVPTFALLVSCKKETQSGAASADGYRSPELASVPEEKFSPWMSKADQQIVYDGLAKGTYFAVVEGRCNGGFQQFRHVTESYPENEFTEWGVFWGLSPEEFYQIDLNMQRKGFVRKTLQVFEDGTGEAFHQGLWILPVKK